MPAVIAGSAALGALGRLLALRWRRDAAHGVLTGVRRGALCEVACEDA